MKTGTLFRIVILISVGNACNGNPVDLPEEANSDTDSAFRRLTEAEQILLATFSNFSISVAKALTDNDVEMMSLQPPVLIEPPKPSSESGVCLPIRRNAGSSAFGLGHLLAIAAQNPWPMNVPVFEEVVKSAPESLPDAFEFIFKDLLKDPDVKFSSKIFTSEKIEQSPALDKLKVEIVDVDLSEKKGIESINNNLNEFTGNPSKESYIPEESVLSPSIKGLLVDTLHIDETWPNSPSKVPSPPKFMGKETVEMIEIKGQFQVLESEKAIQIFMPFQNKRRALSLILPYDIQSGLKGDLGIPEPVNYTTVRVQLPIFTASTRNYENDLTTLCKNDMTNSENFFQLVDHTVFISLNEEKFEAISTTGAQINDVAKFKETHPVSSENDPVASLGENKEVPCEEVDLPSKTEISSNEEEKLIIFDRAFTWSLMDENLGPIFTGSVFSIEAADSSSTSASSIFGQEGGPLSYGKCFQ